MSVFTFSIVLLAAALHAVWNALVKAAADRAVVLGMISFGHVILGVGMAVMAPLPAMESWGFIVGSTLIHWGYYFFLYHSYRLGDLSQVYPIARGIAPVLVALGAQYFAGEVLPLMAWVGIVTVSVGIMMLSSKALLSLAASKVTGVALITGAIIAAYSIVDGMGVRVSGNVLGYVAWLFIFEGFVSAFIFYRRGSEMLQLTPRVWIPGMAGGLISGIAYGLAIYAKSLTYLGLVSTLRETSVIFAAMIGILVLGERPWKSRIAAATVVVIGIIVMTLAANV
ncbi:MAG: EamA family transporter [Rhodobacteraceae bacterium]|nr:EamA family transporter [Paracoccaceae bacterium]